MFEIVEALRAADYARAEVLCRARLRADPASEDLLVLLALCLGYQGRSTDALEVYRQLTEFHPQSSLHWGNLATALRQAGQADAAEAAALRGLQLAPSDPDLLDTLGMLELHRRAYAQARDHLFQALSARRDSAEIAIHCAQACIACRDYRADDLVRGWQRWLPLADGPQMDLAHTLFTLGDANGACGLLEELTRRTPDHWPAQALLGSVYERVNRLDDARSQLEGLRERAPATDETLRLELAHLEAKLVERAGDLLDARRILETCGPRNDHDCDHYFVLAQVCDRQGDVDQARQAFVKAHVLQVEDLVLATPHRFEADAPVFPAAVHKVTAEAYARWPRLPAPDAPVPPVFIVGFPRSGTTLLEQMLDAHAELQSMDERPFFNVLGDRLGDAGIRVPQDIEKLSARDCDELRQAYAGLVASKIDRQPGRRLVDKNPLNMLWLPLIHRLFPQAHFILALRHPADVIMSNYRQNFRASVLAAACRSPEVLAGAYVTAMDYWLHHVELFRPKVYVSRYESLVADPGKQAREIADFLGLRDSGPLLEFDRRAKEKGYIATPSYSQVIEPINDRSIGRWRQYRGLLESALPILQPMLDRWGYTLD